jgi:hypothetical protein
MAKKFMGTALVYLLLGLLAQAVVMFDVWLGFNPLAYTAAITVEQLLLLGWLTQLGLALIFHLWLTTSRHAAAGMVLFILFNLGLPLAILGQPGLLLFGGRWLGALSALGGLLMLFAGLILTRQLWPFLRSLP